MFGEERRDKFEAMHANTNMQLSISFNTLKTAGAGREEKIEQLQPLRLIRTEEYHMWPINLSIHWITQASFSRKNLLKLF